MARSAKAALKSKGWNATRNNGGMSARDAYKEYRSFGATAQEAYQASKAYKDATVGDYR